MKINNTLEKNIKLLKLNIEEKDIIKFEKAYSFAKNKYKDDKNLNGEYIIVYTLRSSLLLSNISNNVDLITVCLFRDILKYSNKEELTKVFGEEIYKLVDNITELSNIKYNEGKNKKNLDLFQKIFNKYLNNINFFLIKICLRFDYIQNFGVLSNERKKIIARETLDIYIPLIKNFSLAKYFPNIEDLCYKFIKPEEYKRINEKLLKQKNTLENKIKEITKTINNIAKKNNIKVEIESRIKSIYSIHKKMESKKIPISSIYDLIAFRIITNKKREVYLFLGLIHSFFKSKNNRIKDYISLPKRNGYQSIHTTVSDNDGFIFEIQIQTKEMYKYNLFGIASHDNYKGFFKKNNFFPEWMKILNEEKKKTLFRNNFIDSFDITIFTGQISCYTLNGDKIELPKESIILDFAFKIHSNIGNRVIGAWVNGEYIENLGIILKNGDNVHLNLSENDIEYPVSYIGLLKTKNAKRHFKNSFKNKSKSKLITFGKHLLNEKMELFGYKSFEKMPILIKNEILKTFNTKEIEDFYTNIGNGKIKVDKILNIIYNFDYDKSKYRTIVRLKIIFKQKSQNNINAISKLFYDLNINIININYKGINITTEINVKNISLLRDLLIEISRIPNVLKVTRLISIKLKIFIISFILASLWIILTPIILLFIKNFYLLPDYILKGGFYLNITFLISLLYFFKHILKATLPGLIKHNLFWLGMFLLNTFTFFSVVYEAIYIFKIGNSVFLFSFILILYGLTTFEYLDSKFNNKNKHEK